MNRAAPLAVLLALSGPVFAQSSASPGGAGPGAGPGTGAGRGPIDPLTSRPGVTAPDAPLYDPVTGMPTQARIIARGRAGSALNPPPPAASADPFGTQTSPGLPSRSGLANAPPPIDPFTAQPGVQQMRTGTYDPNAGRPGTSPQPGAPQRTQQGFPSQPGFPGQAGAPRPYGAPGTAGAAGVTPGYPSGGYPSGGYPSGGYGGSLPALDPYTGNPADKYSYGRR